MTTKSLLVFGTTILFWASCTKSFEPVKDDKAYEEASSALSRLHENPGTFSIISTTDIGETGAAEISTYDKKTKRLFVVNNSAGNNKIDVLDFSDPTHPVSLPSINVAAYGGFVNSVAAYDGHVAAAIEAIPKTNAGKVVVFNATNYAEIKVIMVGALPDDIKYSKDGKFILTANEGEPSADYLTDPLGTVSIISVKEKYTVTTLDFSSFAANESELKSRGLRKYGPGASFAQDMEPEFIAISADSRIAWVTLQENNAIAKVDIKNKVITNIFPLGFKNFNLSVNAFDPSDRPLGTLAFNQWPVYGMYEPDGIAVLDAGDDDDDDHDKAQFKNDNSNGTPYLFTANEGDARDYAAFSEEARIGSSSVVLDPNVFPNSAMLKLPENLGRLNITKTLGDTDGDKDYDALYSLGGRSFSVWNGNTGSLLFDSKNELEQKSVTAGFYDDDRSDNKGVEPEGITIGRVNKKTLAFVGMERADAVAIYDVTNPLKPKFLQILQTGEAPEGILFISAKDSPNKRSLLVVSSENDGQIKVYMPK